MQPPTWSYLIPFAVAVIALVGGIVGVVGQQAVDVWKVSKQHRQELERRLFDAKFKTATDVSILLSTSASFIRARLEAATEWSSGTNRQDLLDVRQQVLDFHSQALGAAFNESHRAFAMMELLFPSSVHPDEIARVPFAKLEDAWRAFDDKRLAFKEAFTKMMPDARAAELRLQRERGNWTPSVEAEIKDWVAFADQGLSELRHDLIQIRQLTDSYEREVHNAIGVLRQEFRRYES